MPKKFIVTATVTTDMYAVVKVPDDWTAEDVEAYYHMNGASGEFLEDPFGNSWTWGSVEEDDGGCAFTDTPTAFLTDEDKVN